MRPAHHEPTKVQGAINEIIDGAIYGGLIGLMAGTAFHMASMRFWPRYSALTVQFRTFIGVGFVVTPACWRIDNNLLKYERKISLQHKQERRRKLEAAVESGEYSR